jgi:ABC-2 type transport system permease protein
MNMKALKIASKDLQVFFKDRGAILTLFVLPLVFVVVFSGALTSIGVDEDVRVALAVVNLDSGEAAQELLDGINNAGGVIVELYAEDEAISLLEEKEIPRVLIIPADFTAGMDAHHQVTVQLINHPDADMEQTEAVSLVIDGVTQDMALESQIVASLEQMGEMQANAPEEFQVFTTQRNITQAQSQFENSQNQSLVSVDQKIPGQTEKRKEDLREHSAVPGIAVMFVFLTAQSAAHMVFDEKKVGAFRRLLAAPVSKADILIGKMIPNIIIGLIQIAVIFAFGVLGMKLLGFRPMSLGNDPLALVIVAFLVALCSSSLGVVIAALARTENQIGGLSTLLLWVLAILGGSIIPLFYLESFLGPIPKLIPHYWANRAFSDLTVRGLGIGDITLEMGVILLFCAIFFAIGLWRFDFD